MTPSTPKTFVLLASNAPVAVILYRKSHLTTYCLHLNYEQRHKRHIYELTKGSRFYGRLFPHRCHLSSDGTMLVYFAMRGRKTGEASDPATWTAVCTPPWLKAHLFFPMVPHGVVVECSFVIIGSSSLIHHQLVPDRNIQSFVAMKLSVT